MNTKPSIHLQLNDGKTVIDRWSHSLDDPPTIGDVISIRSVGGRTPAGYQENATVFRIERDIASGEITALLDLSPVTAKTLRNVVYLNEDYIPEALRREVEEHLRGRIELPVFEWIQSTEPAPIVRLSGPARVSPHELTKLQAAVRKLVEAASPLATV